MTPCLNIRAMSEQVEEANRVTVILAFSLTCALDCG